VTFLFELMDVIFRK